MRSSFPSGVTLSSKLSPPAPSLPSLCHSFKSLQRQHVGRVTENRWVLLPRLWAPGDLCPARGWGGGRGSVLLQPNDMLPAFPCVCSGRSCHQTPPCICTVLLITGGFPYFRTFLRFLDAVIGSYCFSCYYDFSSVTFYSQSSSSVMEPEAKFPENRHFCLPSLLLTIIYCLISHRFRINLDFSSAVAISALCRFFLVLRLHTLAPSLFLCFFLLRKKI